MPITIQLPGSKSAQLFDRAFNYFRTVDQQFSPYIKSSEVSRINRIKDKGNISKDMRLILKLAEQTRQETNGYFDVWPGDIFDPSGIVKGWAIQKASDLLIAAGQSDFYVEAGGDIMTGGHNDKNEAWRVGIRNPFNRNETIKIVHLSGEGIATSGTATRGQHIYNPHHLDQQINDIVSLTVIAPTIYDADRFATAAFAMGKDGIRMISDKRDIEGYMIDANGIATMTDGFERYVK